MDGFTYEKNDTSRKLENFEWDNVWWEQTANASAKRIAYIGDSISCGTRHLITKLSESEILCDGFATSKALDNPYFKPSLELFFEQQTKCDAILFNNGLHGFHLSEEQYAFHYRDMLRFLSCNFPDIPLAVALSTYSENENCAPYVIPRNECARNLAKEMDIPIIDLYSVSEENKALLAEDKAHFTTKGYTLLGETLAKRVIEIMES
jgi:hypothetical protein